MKHFAVIILAILGLVSCQSDFDEVNDTSQRSITFCFDTSHYFDKVAVLQDGKPSVGVPSALPSTHRLRLTCLCYAPDGTLLDTRTALLPSMGQASVSMRHLDKDTRYHFGLIADVVLHDPAVEYYETWYILNSGKRGTLRMASFDYSPEVQLNSLLFTSQDIRPAGQTVDIAPQMLTYTVFCRLVGLSVHERATLTATYPHSFTLEDMEPTHDTFMHTSTFSPGRPGDELYIPYVCSSANKDICLHLEVRRPSGTYESDLELSLDTGAPLVATIDCSTMAITDISPL